MTQTRASPELATGDSDARVEQAWRGGRWQAVVQAADRMITADRQDFHGHALKYLALLELKKDRMEATKAAVAAIKDLGRGPKAMAEFLNSALLRHPNLNDYQLALMAIVPLVADGRKIGAVRIAHIRALAGCGKFKEAIATNRTVVNNLKDSTDDLFALAEGICDTKGGAALKSIARQALVEVMKKRESDTGIQMLRYRVLHDLEGDEKAARVLGLKILREGTRGSINVWLWRLVTARATKGRYPSLALLAAREMIRTREVSGHALDTIALALFENGLLDEALETQQRAVDSDGPRSTPGMRRRLGIYRGLVATRNGKKK